MIGDLKMAVDDTGQAGQLVNLEVINNSNYLK
jgi:hypothetical protein